MLVQVLGNQAPNLTMSGYPLHQLEALDTRNQNLNNLAITWHYLADQHTHKKKDHHTGRKLNHTIKLHTIL